MKFTYAIIEEDDVYFRIEDCGRLYKRKIIGRHIMFNNKYYSVSKLIGSLKFNVNYEDILYVDYKDGNPDNLIYTNIEAVVKPQILSEFEKEFKNIKLKDVDI